MPARESHAPCRLSHLTQDPPVPNDVDTGVHGPTIAGVQNDLKSLFCRTNHGDSPGPAAADPVVIAPGGGPR